MTILIDNYHDFLNKEILSLRSYLPSSKLLSFSLRIKDDNGKESQNILAFCSLKENNLLPEEVGCQILEFNNCDFRADEKFFDYLHTRVLMWDNIGNRRFDYIGFSVNAVWQNVKPAIGAIAAFNSTTLYGGIFYDFLLGTSGFSIQPEIGYGMAIHVYTTTQEALRKTDGVYVDQLINFSLRFDYSFPGFSRGNLEIALEPVYTIMPEQKAVVQFFGFKLGMSYGFPD